MKMMVKPIIIKKIEVGSEDASSHIISAYGSKIMSENTMYLTPRIDILALQNQKIKLYVKLIKEGVLCTGETSPFGYTYNDEVDILGDSELDLSGWGGNVKGEWLAGNYRFEVWYNGYCLKSLDFRIE